MTTRLFNKVVAGTGPSRSVPAAATRLPRHHYEAVVKSFFFCEEGLTTIPFDLNVLRTYLTHKTLVLAITHLSYAALCKNRALLRATGNDKTLLPKLRTACAKASQIVTKQLKSKLEGKASRLSLPCTAEPPKVLVQTPVQITWGRLHSMLGVKARLPHWVVNENKDAAIIYKTCLTQPRQLCDALMNQIGLQGTGWEDAFDATKAREFLKTTTRKVKSILYILVHAYNLRRALIITTAFNTKSDFYATVCASCMSLRTQAHSLPVIKSKRSGIMLDIRNRRAMCADCMSSNLVRVSIGSRNIAVRTSKAVLASAACGGCGRLCNVTTEVGGHPKCKRCSTQPETLQCFCRAPSRCTVGSFLTVFDNKIVLCGVCNRHASFLPQSIEHLTVIAKRANIRI